MLEFVLNRKALLDEPYSMLTSCQFFTHILQNVKKKEKNTENCSFKILQ